MKTLLMCGLLSVMLAAPLGAAGALSEFAEAWSAIDNYSCTIQSHDVEGTNVQDRTEHYWFKKPTNAKIEIVAGPGRGSGAVWHGGDKVLGHLGGILAGIKQSVSINDRRATSLRGDTIESASFAGILAYYQGAKGTISESAGEAINGTPTDEVSLKIANVAANHNVTRDVLYLSKATHLPVRRVKYEGDTLVKQQDFSSVKLNPGLKDSDF